MQMRSRRDSFNLLQQLKAMNGVRSARRATFVQKELSEHLLALHEGISERDKHIAKLQQQVRMLLDERKALLASGLVEAGVQDAATTNARGIATSAKQDQSRVAILESENTRLARMVRELRVDNVGLGFVGRSRKESKVAAVVEEEWI